MNLDADITPEELKIFLEEAEEQIELMDEDIIRLEKERENPDLLQEIFRAAHTIKGSSAMVGYQQMAELTHVMESLLDKLRNKELSVSTEIIDVLLFSLDILKTLKNEITSQEDNGVDIEPALAKLREVVTEDAEQTQEMQAGEIVLSLDQDAKESLKTALAEGQNAYHIKVSVNKESDWVAVRCLQCLIDLARIGKVIGSAPATEEIEEEKIGFNLEIVLVSLEGEDAIRNLIYLTADIDNVEIGPYRLEETVKDDNDTSPAVQRTEDRGSKAADPKGKAEVVQQEIQQNLKSVRVDVTVLDSLMNIVEELVIDHSKISQVGKVLETKYASDESVRELTQISDHIIKIINELQENIMQVRMIPIGTIFSRFPRMVRDLAQTQKKKLDFVVEGGETELDRSLIEQIHDPLIHLLRNAVDHGIELPEERKNAHKPATASVRLTAQREQSHIAIIVEDDGRGIAADKVIASATKKGLISVSKAESLTEADAINLIFMPGMSTAEKATEVSGRGVGMDIVRANVENLGGSIIIDTRVGQGSKFVIRLPLTVAIIQGFLVSAGGAIYVLPLSSIAETLAIESRQVQHIRGREIIRWRDSLIPLVRLNITLYGETGEPESRDKGIVVVVRTDGYLLGLVIDEVMEPQEVVVKSLGSYLGDVEGIAGATILGDGRVALILDVASLAKRAAQTGRSNLENKSRAVAMLSPTAAR